ncbi:MAG: bifunctional hydroxymethylpyrimidine kinase/phosphomethylpyrimidine kinase [Clostridia bacterium]|nr:bifunctional hydroxymethylpyrimidine kinase/phosphomethylpyrimidine kinase [Clostridia bacterium]
MIQKRILTMQDLSCFGKCSISMSVAVLSACGHEAVALPTALLSTHTSEFSGYTFLDLAYEDDKIIEHFKKLNLKFDAILIGYLGSIPLIERAKKIVEIFGKGAVVVVDPAMAENDVLYSGFDMSYVNAMRTLCEMADFITPNTSEYKLLVGVKNARVLQTGVEKDGMIGIRLDQKEWLRPAFDGQFYGAGDAFSSAFTGLYMKTGELEKSIEGALDFVWGNINATQDEKEKYWYGTKFEQNLEFLVKFK